MNYMDGYAHEHLFDPEKLWDNGTPTNTHTKACAQSKRFSFYFFDSMFGSFECLYVQANVLIAETAEHVPSLFHPSTRYGVTFGLGWLF